MLFRLSFMSLLILTTLLGCGDSTAPLVPTTVTISAPNTLLESLGEAVQLTAQVMDQKGNVMSGIPMDWVSDDRTVAEVETTSGLVTGVGQGTATISGSAGNVSGTIQITVTQTPSQLEGVQGDTQTGFAGTSLSDPIRVQVRDARSNPIIEVEVTFAVTEGGGSASPSSIQTDASGEAEVVWTLGPEIGQQSAAATVEGLVPVVFRATATRPPVAEVVVDPSAANLEVGATVPLSASALDPIGEEIPGIGFAWDSSDPTVATVTQDGVVTGASAGVVNITATTWEVSDTAQVFVFEGQSAGGIRVEAPDTVQIGQVFPVRLVVDLTDVPGLLGAIATSLFWDPAVLGLEGLDAFDSEHWFAGVRWDLSGEVRTVVSIPNGLSGEVTILQFNMRVIGGSGSATTLGLTLNDAISALTFLDLSSHLVAEGTAITVQ